MRLDGIDILRGFAVSFVVFYHFFELLNLQNHFLYTYAFSLGQLGVPLFFVISGYLIYHSVEAHIRQKGTFVGVRTYFLHRLFRILPAYYINFFVVFLLAYFIFGTMDTWSFSFIKREIVTHLTFTSYFIYKSSGLGINGAYWTLSIEMLWYILAPILFILIKKDRYYGILFIVACLYILSIDLHVWDDILGLSHAQSNYLPMQYFLYFQLPSQILYFLVGIFIYKYSLQTTSLRGSYFVIFFLLIASIFYMLSSTSLFINIFLIKMFITLLAVFCLFLLFYNKKLEVLKPLSWIGKISYSLYLWHMPLLYAFQKYNLIHELNLMSVVALFLFLLFVISSLSYYYVEKGGFRLRHLLLK
jgi:peptidoglycan/LPS O-acetylase OafA/YrhL